MLLQTYFLVNILYLNSELNEARSNNKIEKIFPSGLKRINYLPSSAISSFDISENGVIELINIFILEDSIPYVYRKVSISAFDIWLESYGYNNKGNLYLEQTEISAGKTSRTIMIDTSEENRAKFNLDEVKEVIFGLPFSGNLDTTSIEYRDLDVIKMQLEVNFKSLRNEAIFRLESLE